MEKQYMISRMEGELLVKLMTNAINELISYCNCVQKTWYF